MKTKIIIFLFGFIFAFILLAGIYLYLRSKNDSPVNNDYVPTPYDDGRILPVQFIKTDWQSNLIPSPASYPNMISYPTEESTTISFELPNYLEFSETEGYICLANPKKLYNIIPLEIGQEPCNMIITIENYSKSQGIEDLHKNRFHNYEYPYIPSQGQLNTKSTKKAYYSKFTNNSNEYKGYTLILDENKVIFVKLLLKNPTFLGIFETYEPDIDHLVDSIKIE